MSFVIDETVTDKPPKKTVVSQFIGNNSIGNSIPLEPAMFLISIPDQSLNTS